MSLRFLAVLALVASPALASQKPVEAAAHPVPANQSLLPAPAPAKVALVAPVAKKPRMICQTDVETGSLVKRARRCGTAESWRKGDDAARETYLSAAIPGGMNGEQANDFTAPPQGQIVTPH